LPKFSTPLLDIHEEKGASLGEFANWKMPIDYGDMLGEALATRSKMTVFDISHLTRIIVEGEDSKKFVNWIVAKNIAKLAPGWMMAPTAMLNENAGFVDDVAVYCLENGKYMIVGNAINKEKDLEWLSAHSSGFNVKIRDITEETAMIALQGPKSPSLAAEVVSGIEDLAPLQILAAIKSDFGEILVASKSGWTGESGFEFIGSPETIGKLLRHFLDKGAAPAGLGARDILRIEMGFCLYGEDIDENVTPIEARYWVFSWKKKEEYIGKDALHRKIVEGVNLLRVGFEAKARMPIPRHGAKIRVDRREIGYVTSSTFSPWLKRVVGMGYVKASHAIFNVRVNVDVRGRLYQVTLKDFPFVKPKMS